MNTALFSGSDLDVVFSLVLTMSLSASWIAAAVLVLRLCLKRAPKWVNVLLWGIVAVRLVLPVSIESPLSLLPRTEAILPAVTAQPIQTGTAPAVGSAAAIASGAAMRSQPGWTTILAWVWLVGIAVLLLYTWISTQRLRRKVREAVRLRGNIYETEHITSPFVLGVLRPRIYLPYHMDSRDREQVIAHEQAHLRRGDHVWKPLGFLLLTIHWFNPLLWLSYVLLCRDIELACDEKVIKNLSCGQRADYMQALVTCSVNRRRIAACPLAFGEIGVKERVKSVMNYKKPTFWIILLAVAACVVLAVCFLTNPIGFRYDAAADPIVSAKYFDARNHTDPIAVDLSAAQIDELSSRLDGLKNTKTSDTLAGWTPMYQISAQLQDGSYIRANGYSSADDTQVDLEWIGVHYLVTDREFQDYLSRVCAGADVAAAEEASARETPALPADTNAAEPEQPTESDALGEKLAESDALGEKLAETETEAEALDHDPVLDDAISKAVLDHYADAVQPGQIHVESHVLLAQDDSSADTITVYLLVLQETYSADGETLTMENGSYVPTAITFSLSTSSGPTPLEYWEPSDGSYSDDIRAKFPAAAAEEALNDQAYIDALRSACEEQAQKARTSTQG